MISTMMARYLEITLKPPPFSQLNHSKQEALSQLWDNVRPALNTASEPTLALVQRHVFVGTINWFNTILAQLRRHPADIAPHRTNNVT